MASSRRRSTARRWRSRWTRAPAPTSSPAGSTTTGDETDFALATYQPAGKLDKHFGQGGIVTTPFPGLSTQIQGVAYQSDGTLVAGGGASDNPNHGEFAAARYLGR